MKRRIALMSLILAALLWPNTAAAHNNALAFDGVDDFVEVAGLPAPSNTGAVTIEFWNFVRSTDVRRLTYSFAFVTDNNEIRTSAHAPWGDSFLYWDCGNLLRNGRLKTNYRPYLDRWTHVALVSAGKGGRFMGIYLNGVLVASKLSSEGPSKDLRGLRLGASGSAKDAKFLRGSIDEFRVWNRVRSAVEIQRDMNAELLGDEPGLVSYYTFNYGRPNLQTLPNKVDGAPAGILRNFTISGDSSNFVLSGAPLTDYQGLTPRTTSQSTLDAFYASYAGKATFTDQYEKALSTMLNAQDDVVGGRYTNAKQKLDGVWAAYPKGDRSWLTAGASVTGPMVGAPAAYNALRMLDDVVAHGLVTGPPPVARNLRMTVVLVGCSNGYQPSTMAELAGGTGTLQRRQILPDLTANNNRILNQSLALFRDYVHAMTGGRDFLDLGVVSLPDVCVQISSSYADAQASMRPGDLSAVWTSVPTSTRQATDWWWVIYPSQVPDDVPAFATTAIITGGMYLGDAPGPVFVIDDRWLTRKPGHLGSGPYSDVERRAWLPQWLQHEFFHYLYALYPGFQLEATGHQWQLPNIAWPVDFDGNAMKIEADYYAESLHKRLQTAQAVPPLQTTALRIVVPRAEWARLMLTSADVLGSYQTADSGNNDWLKGQIEIDSGSLLRWRNAAGRSWKLTPDLAAGRLATGDDNPYKDKTPDFNLVLTADADGNLSRPVLGFRFGSTLYLKR